MLKGKNFVLSIMSHSMVRMKGGASTADILRARIVVSDGERGVRRSKQRFVVYFAVAYHDFGVAWFTEAFVKPGLAHLTDAAWALLPTTLTELKKRMKFNVLIVKVFVS